MPLAWRDLAPVAAVVAARMEGQTNVAVARMERHSAVAVVAHMEGHSLQPLPPPRWFSLILLKRKDIFPPLCEDREAHRLNENENGKVPDVNPHAKSVEPLITIGDGSSGNIKIVQKLI